jgi:DNA-binding Lrp family transcriptional regulator
MIEILSYHAKTELPSPIGAADAELLYRNYINYMSYIGINKFNNGAKRRLAVAMAYVLINAETGCCGEVIEALRRLPEVKEAYAVQGAYDIVARLEAQTMEEIKNALSWKIRRLERVRSARTTIVV